MRSGPRLDADLRPFTTAGQKGESDKRLWYRAHIAKGIHRVTLPGLSAKRPQNAKPLLKWPGGKRHIVKDIAPHLPRDFKRYIEPFFGGGAVFFWLDVRHATIGDVNARLIECYRSVRDDPAAVFESLSRLRNTERAYYRVRSWEPTNRFCAAAKLIYLCTLSFNGIYRENLRGEYNVPYGYKTEAVLPTLNDLLAVAGKLEHAKFVPGDFTRATVDARCGDLVYLDPPYTVAHNKNGFVKYNSKIFSWDDQIRLAKEASRLSALGAFVVISNADHHSIGELYPNFKRIKISRISRIAASSYARTRVTEGLYLSPSLRKVTQ